MSGIEAVKAYAAAKCRADAAAAVEYLTEDFVCDTFPFQLASNSKADSLRQFEGFFELFPDYGVDVEEWAEQGERVFAWGHISGTMRGPLLDLEPTGRSFRVPASFVWKTRGDLVAWEGFYFDLNHVCEQLGLDTAEVAARFRTIRELLEAHPASEPAAAAH